MKPVYRPAGFRKVAAYNKVHTVGKVHGDFLYHGTQVFGDKFQLINDILYLYAFYQGNQTPFSTAGLRVGYYGIKLFLTYGRLVYTEPLADILGKDKLLTV